MTRNYILIYLAIIGTTSTTLAQSNELFTIYLVRHSEKDHSSPNQSDLPLSQCGEQRSYALSNFLSDVQLEAIYSTDYTRTLSTAHPTATSKSLEIQTYHPSNLEEFARTLLNNQQNALVVGHSNTTGYLAGFLIGEEGEDISLDTYDRIYQVDVSGTSTKLHLIHSSFECDE
ncbi:MAG: histidine phosphatase family protein [Euryarchaeota archaeon]|nr:histidine phosphatase family protein [Euryarchaeota archaeon]|tara:strand:+ start:445 stop:963 length:519 start_codon:yes stop_codon:yes gene_type:complete